MATYTSSASGNWSAGATWVGGVKPPANAGHKIVIASGHTVTYDETSSTYGDDTSSGTTVNGTLKFARGITTEYISRGEFIVSSTGTLDMGTEADRITGAAVLKINDSASLGALKWKLTKASGGKIYTAGKARSRRPKATSALSSGGTTIQVASATGWDVGDSLVLLPTEHTTVYSNAVQFVTIASGYTPGSTTVPISAGSLMGRANGFRVCNITSNVRITQMSATHGSQLAANTSGSVWLVDSIIALNANHYNPPVKIGAGYISGPPEHFARSTAFVCDVATEMSSMEFGKGMKVYDSIVCSTLSSGFFTSHWVPTAADVDGLSVFTPCWRIAAGSGFSSPIIVGDINDVDCLLLGTFNFESYFFLVMGGAIRNSSFATLYPESNSFGGAAWYINSPGFTYENCNFAPLGGSDSRAAFTPGGDPSGGVIVSNTRIGDTAPRITYGQVPGWSVSLVYCTRQSAPSVQIHEKWANAGVARRVTSPIKNSISAWEFEAKISQVPFSHQIKFPIGIGQTKTLRVALRRDATWGSGAMPSVSLSIPGVTTVTTAAADAANTWDVQSISITNSTGLASEVTITLAASAPTINGKCYFSGIPVGSFIPAARWYGYVFDEANPFVTVDSTLALTESAADAVSGVAINHTAQTITVTAARTAAEVYCYCILDLVNNLDASGNYRTRHITSSDGASFATTYTVIIGSGGSISGRYSDANGAVVSASVTNIVTGSRILIKRTDTDAVMANAIVSGTSYSLNVQTASAIPISVTVRKATAAPFYQEWATSGSIDPVGGFAATANQIPD